MKTWKVFLAVLFVCSCSLQNAQDKQTINISSAIIGRWTSNTSNGIWDFGADGSLGSKCKYTVVGNTLATACPSTTYDDQIDLDTYNVSISPEGRTLLLVWTGNNLKGGHGASYWFTRP